MWPRLLSLCLAAAPALAGSPPEVLKLEGDISPIHDPAIIRQGGTYHLFASNRFAEKLVPMFCSTYVPSSKSPSARDVPDHYG